MPFFQGVFGKNYYEVHGEGFPLVFIPGMGASHREWFQQVPVFSKQHQVITPDNAGSGKSVHPDVAISIPEMAEDVSRLVSHLKLHKVVLIGSSMGGVIAQCCLELFPDRIAAMVLSATFEHADAHILKVLSPILRSRQSPKVRVRNVLPLLVAERFIREEPRMARRYVDLAEKMAPPREVLKRQVRAILNFVPHPPRRTLKLPMMILAGREDPITTVAMAGALHRRYPHSTLHVLEGARHLLHVECAKTFNDLLENFLKATTVSAP